MELKEKFVGTWELEDFYMHTQNGVDFYPFGKKPKGLIIYNSDDYMSVIITCDNDFCELSKKNSLNELSEEDQQFFKTNSFSYTGTFKIDEEKRVVIHNVQATSLQNAANSQFTRFYELDGDKLVLSTLPMEVGNITKKPLFLVWKRVN
ncbi:TPA: lipocalin-like domain-containing protein [Bacillus cereus]|nr:lipocalin-like domain-containing protein [Bacillus cereus]